MLSPKETCGVGLYPYRIPYAANLTDFSSSQSLPEKATLSDWFDGGSGYEHVHIDKNGSAISVRFNNGGAQTYVGAVGGSYADLLKNVLTHYKGGFAGLHADLHCCGQRLEASVFGQPSPVSPLTWVPREVVIPTAQEEVLIDPTLGTLVSVNVPERPEAAFDSVISQRHDVAARSVFSSSAGAISCALGRDYGLGNEQRVSKAVWYGPNNYGTVYGATGTQMLTLLGSPDGADWTNLGSVLWTGSVSNEQHLVASSDVVTTYRFLRALVNANVTQSSRYISCAELQFFTLKDFTYGDSGVHLDFAIEADLGNDSSTNNNDWVVTGSRSTNTPTN